MELSKHLLPSHSVELSVSVQDEQQKPSILKLKTIIETGYENGFFKIVSPMLHGRMYVLHDDEVIAVTFFIEEDNVKAAYEVNCKVLSKQHVGSMYSVTLRVISTPKKVQRRDAFRVNILNKYSTEYKGKHIELVTKDVSSTGMRVLSPVQMYSDDNFTITFDANVYDEDDLDFEPDPDKIFTINCRVIDSFPQPEIRRYMVRIKFLELSNQNSKLIIQYLYARQSEIIAYDTTLSAKRAKIENLFDGNEDRRIGDDPIIKRFQAIGLLNYILVFFALVSLLFAQPKPLYALDKFFNINRAKYWNSTYFNVSLFFTLSTIASAIYGLILNSMRMKRRSDQYSSALIGSLVIGIILLLSIIYLLSTQNIYNVVY